MTSVAILQLEAHAGGVQRTLERIEDALVRAGEAGAVLLIAPELATTGYGAADEFADLAETASGPVLSRLFTAVERTGVGLVVGFAESAGDGVHNAAAVLAPGALPVVYRKTQLYGDYEKAHFRASPVSTVTAHVAGLKIGVLICFDVEFPEHVRRLAQAGCDLVAVPTATPTSSDSEFIATKLVPVRAFENHVFLAYANWSGRDDLFDYAGLSVLAAPDGTELTRAPVKGDHLGFAEVRPDDYAATRAENPYLAELKSG